MLKFFRRIRRQLLSENRFSKYLIYAAGEIVLVVIGILIALQINNWNEARKSSIQATSFVKAIKANLTADLDQLTVNENYINDYEKMGFDLWNFLYVSPEDADTAGLNRAYLQVPLQREFSPTKTAYENVVSSGNINLIKHNRLKDLLADFYKDDLFDRNAKAQRNRVENLYYDLRYDYIHPLMHRDFLAKEMLKVNDFDSKNYKIDWESVREDPDYKKVLGRLQMLRVPSRRRLNNIRDQINTILNLIDSEVLTNQKK